MARAQVYRGNPETKQTIIFDNFSGGINTTSIDEQVLTNEFRKLKNVELKEEGRIQNRKGFKNIIGLNNKDIFKDIIDIYYVGLVEDSYNEMKNLLDSDYTPQGNIVIDMIYTKHHKVREVTYTRQLGLSGQMDDLSIPQNSVSFKMSEIVDIDNLMCDLDFRYVDEESEQVIDGMYYYDVYDCGIRTIIESGIDTSRKDIYLTRLEINGNREDKLISTLSNEMVKPPKMTGLNMLKYDGKNIFLLNEILEGSEKIIEWEGGENNSINLVTVDKTNSYSPNVSEFPTIGFNVFSNNPQDHISSVDTSLETITGIFLRDYNNRENIIDKIPLDGKFIVSVYYTGNYIKDGLELKFFYNRAETERTYIDATVTLIEEGQHISGILYYEVELGEFSISEEITVELNKSIFLGGNLDIPESNIFDTFDDIKELFRDPRMIFLNKDLNSPQRSYYKITEKVKDSWETVKDVPVKNPDNDQAYPTGYYPMLFNNSSNSMTPETLLYPKTGSMLEEGIGSKWFDYVFINYGGKLGEVIAHRNTLSATDSVLLFSEPYTEDMNYVHTLIPQFDDMLNIGNTTSVAPKNYNSINSNNIIQTKDYKEFIINRSEIYKIGVDYYQYNGLDSGTLDDFDEIELPNEEIIQLNYLNTFSIGNPSVTVTEPLDFSNLKATIIGDNLVLYGGNTLLYSEPYSTVKDSFGNTQGFSYFTNKNWISFPLSMGDEIVKIGFYRGSHIIFTKESIYRLSGVLGDINTLEVVMINDSIGCVSPDSVRSINNTLVFLSETGIYNLKQSYYMDGLENVGKIDSKIAGVIPYGTNYESILYNEQYLLFVKDNKGNYVKTVKQYYNIDPTGKNNPYVVDVYEHAPDLVFRMNENMYAMKDGKIYLYDEGYTDFFPYNAEEDDFGNLYDKIPYTYEVEIETPNWSLGYPVHEKKWKNVFLRIDSLKKFTIDLKIAIDKVRTVSSENYVAILNALGEIEYVRHDDDLLSADPFKVKSHVTIVPYDLFGIDLIEIGDGELGVSMLGERAYQIHKISPGNKGKTIQFNFKINSPNYFALDTLSIVYKLGKMRESR